MARLDSPTLDEKVALLDERRRKGRRISRWLVVCFPVLALAAATCLLALSLGDWPTENARRKGRHPSLKWKRCPDSHETFCAYLEVPLDHLQPDRPEKVSLALRKLPASVPRKERRGTLLTNPGGPGGSGTEQIASLGRNISETVEGKFDIVSWDPRAVNLTLPSVSCFANEALARLHQRDWEALGLLYEAQPSASLDFDAEPISRSELAWARRIDGFAKALDETCMRSGNRDILRHATTAATARDMKAIMEALGEDGIHYWGFSYGTVLGTTFAAMFPHLANRMVLDGVVDVDRYTNNFWDAGRASMNHTTRTYEAFLSDCAKAGSTACAIARDNDTAATVKARIDELRQRLHDAPLAVASHSKEIGTGLVTTSSIQHVIFRGLYQPKTWQHLAAILNEAYNGNGTGVHDTLGVWDSKLGPRAANKNPFHRINMDVTGSALLTHSIHCTDTDKTALNDTSPETLIRYMREMGTRSISGQAWALWITQCRYWSFEASESYRGPWTRQEGLQKTRNPILFVGNIADPVTPLSAAIKTAEGFGRDSASLLIHNGVGHCTSAQRSNCTRTAIGRYLLDGVLPTWGTTCEIDPQETFPKSS